MKTKKQKTTREEIRAAVAKGSLEFETLLKRAETDSEIAFLLSCIGKLPNGFNGGVFANLCKNSESKEVRRLALKNLGKLKSTEYLSLFENAYKNDKSWDVKKEAVSCMGRLKSELAIPALLKATYDKDPGVVVQAVRGLKPFAKTGDVAQRIRELLLQENGYEYFGEFASVEEPQADLKPGISLSKSCVLRNTVVCGDALSVLKTMPSRCVHLVFTSPPYYNARDYSKYNSYNEYLDTLEEVFLETFRVVQDGRFLVVNTSPVIVPRASRSHQSKRCAIPFDLHARLAKTGWEFVDDIIWEKPDYSVKNRNSQFQQSRKPLAYKPNLITEYVMVYRKKTNKLLDWNISQYDKNIVELSKVGDGFERTNVWKISPKSDKNHSAVFPQELCKRVIEYYSYVGDLVMDPFAGSGTVGKVAEKLNRDFLLVELNKKYFLQMKNERKDALFGWNKTRFLTFEEFTEYKNKIE